MSTIETTGTHAGINLKTATTAQLVEEVDRLDALVAKAKKAARKRGEEQAEAIAAKRHAAAHRKQLEDQLEAAEKALNDRQAS